ncbi:MAG: DegT/DnrJ/EryC1/StrS family aminotransferase, partial [Rhodocyclaceae bacterium]|nr:DegT/DnrJ/EryC1/StrS family aminotransferase [Rhodocyclaceae bacterium]
RVGPDLQADLDHVRDLCRRPAAALFVTHFFGFPQPLDELGAIARERGTLLIEDAAHGLFSATPDGSPLGSIGDMAIFSPWKSLPVPDGGLLRLAPQWLPRGPLPARTPGGASIAGKLRHMIEESLSATHPRAVRTLRTRLTDPAIRWLRSARSGTEPAAGMPVLRGDASAAEAAQVEFRQERGDWGMSPVSTYLLPRVTQREIREERRRNYAILAEGIRVTDAIAPLARALPAHCCPLFFPVVASRPRDFCRHLSASGIGFFRAWCVFHPAIDWESFPVEAHLKQHVVVLPVHQGLGAEQMARIAAAVNEWSVQGAGN